MALDSASAGVLTYVQGSLKDANSTNGSGVSSPAGSSNIQYSDGSGTMNNFGQIDIADDPADPDWVYDQGSTQAITSVVFWSQAASVAASQVPSGTVTIYGSASPTGPWTQIGQMNRSMVRDTLPPNTQTLAGKGFRLPCNGGSFRYIRVNAVTPGSTGGLDNHWTLRRVETNKDIVVHHFHRTSDASSAINDLPRIPYNIVDGDTSTMWNPGASDMVLTLDLGGTAKRFRTITLIPSSGEAGYLPQTGEIRVSSTDDPDNMDMVVGAFNVPYANMDTDGATIVLPKVMQKRFVQIHWSKVRNPALTETRIAELQVDSVPEPPAGQDLTALNIDPAFMIVPNDVSYAATNVAHLTAALAHYRHVYLPAGTYYFNDTIYMPTDSSLRGDGDSSLLRFTTTSSGFRIRGTDRVRLERFQFERTVDNGVEAAIYVYKYNEDVPNGIEIDAVTILNNRSRSGAISMIYTDTASVTNCRILGSQVITSEPDELNPNGGNFWYIYGSGISIAWGRNFYIANNHVEETRNMPGLLPLSPRKLNFLQAGAIDVSHVQFGIVTNNYAKRFGNAFDINGSSHSWVIGNTCREISETGIKFCNGTTDSFAIGNTLIKCGLVGIWFAPGSEDLSAQDNLADGNLISETGQGIGSTGWDTNGFWLNTFGWAPAGICVDLSANPNSVCRNTTVRNNSVISNGAIRSPASTFAVFVNADTYPPVGTVLSNNGVLDGPLMGSFRVNEGDAQRSKVRNFTVTFSPAVTIAPGALQLKRRSDNASPTLTVTNPSNDGMTFLITPSGSAVEVDSLADGIYDFTVAASGVTDVNSRPMPGGNKSYVLHRLFGDVDGDKDVDSADNLNFLRAKGKTSVMTGYRWFLDYPLDNQNGDTQETQQFRQRLGQTLSY